MMTKEEIIKVLESTDGVEDIDLGVEEDGHFNRIIKFTINKQVYIIEWWVNVSYLFVGSNKHNTPFIMFKHIEKNTTWPGYKHGLGFALEIKDMGICRANDNIFYIPIKILRWQEEKLGVLL